MLADLSANIYSFGAGLSGRRHAKRKAETIVRNPEASATQEDGDATG